MMKRWKPKMILTFFFLTFISVAKGAGTLYAAEQLFNLTLAAYPDKANEIKTAFDELANSYHFPRDSTPVDDEEYDFVVVGAGSAGSVVANRLTEHKNWTLLLVEAGGDPIKSTEIPGIFPTYINTSIDWSFKTKRDGTSCLGMNNQVCTWSRGKVMGGSSSFGFTVYERGNWRDFDQWEAQGCTGWGYENVLNYFKKSEDMRSSEVLAFSPEYHSTGGPLKVEEYVTYAHKDFYEHLKNGMKEMGYNVSPDNNGENQTGFTRDQGTLVDGRRCSAAKGFLSPIISRSNFKVTKNSLVTKILIGSNKKAYGVEFTKNGKKIVVKASKEVILSAGVINSAQLLMLSGVGPKEHLKGFNINVLADLPVGDNLQDHLITMSLAYTTNHTDIPVSIEKSMYDFLMKKPSMLTHFSSVAYNGFIKLNGNLDWPNCELATVSFPPKSNLGYFFTEAVGLRDDLQQQVKDLNSQSYLSLPLCSYLRPYSSGKLELRSVDPLDPPVLTTGYLSNDEDIKILLKYFDFVEALVKTDGLKSMNAKLYELKVPACAEKYAYKSRDYRICSLRHFSTSAFHPVGTCKMGASEDPSAVVDPSLKVKGVSGLRVIDASIMPNIVAANTNTATIMIGEKGADLVKDTWLKMSQNN